jgi:hypothetical protein
MLLLLLPLENLALLLLLLVLCVSIVFSFNHTEPLTMPYCAHQPLPQFLPYSW